MTEPLEPRAVPESPVPPGPHAAPEAPAAAPVPQGPPGVPEAPATLPTPGEPPTRRGRPRRRTVVLAIIGVLVLAVVGGLAWFFSPQPLLPEATAALSSTATATFTDAPTGLTFAPAAASPSAGLVIYPGAKVPAEGYAPLARALAERGYLAVVVPMPLNFAIFGVGAADGVIAAHPEVRRWAIGGHSLGGAMAAQYAADHPAAVAGLVLCGAYSASDLSGADLLASSVYGSLDAAVPKIEDPATKALLPPETAYVRIEGGNHEQCGWYTGQPNDPPATISREEQQDRIVEAWAEVLGSIAAAP